MKKVMVVGAGTMGAGIAQVAAQSGYEVVFRSGSAANKGRDAVEKNLARLVEKGKMIQEEADSILKRIQGTTDYADGRDADLVIETTIEDMEVKKKLFKELDEIMRPEAIFVSNTSSLSITGMAAVTKRPEKVIGMHFFNPVPIMKLVEVIKGARTSDETYNVSCVFAEKMGKTPIKVEETPGFAVNRMLVPMINEAAFLLMEGVASPEDIDTGMKLGASHPIGPLALADMIGVDVCLAVMEVLYSEFGDSKYRPCPLMTKMVRAGYLGRKTKRGFFQY